jgi:pyroglutamyl-peptidase
MRALVTGFEPFDGATVNASYEAVRRLPSRSGGLDIITAQLPTSYARSGAALEREIARARPDIVLCAGEAGERMALNIERIAINLQDARIADNDGRQPVDMPVVAGGPAAYLATLPVRAIEEALRTAGLAVEISNSAGTFVCNHVFYTLMHFSTISAAKFRAGFLHVPSLRAQPMANAATPPMTLDDIVRGIRIALEVAQTSVSNQT